MYKEKTMKSFVTVSLVGLVVVSTAAESPEVPKLAFAPLSLTVSRCEQGPFGGGLQPFGNALNFMTTLKSGTQLLVEVTPQAPLKARLVNSACVLQAFRDDRGLDLLNVPKGARGSAVFEDNQALSLHTSEKLESFGFTARSPLVLSSNATRVILEGSLAFARPQSEVSAEYGAFTLTTSQVIRVGPVQLRFSPPQAVPSRQTAANGKEGQAPESRTPPTAVYWNVQTVPDPEAVSVSILIYGADPDVPQFASLTSDANRSVIDVQPADGGGVQDPFKSAFFQSFSCPEGKISRIKVRYTPLASVTRVPFHVETDLGLTSLPPR